MSTKQSTDKVKLLRRHKRLATGLFLLMMVVYGLMVYLSRNYPAPWIGYVRAFSEAAMVGALADWFAVTALFHHPLGIPIPHTNLIERSKKAIGNNLGDFVVNNFLTPQNIRPYMQKLAVSAYIAEWLSQKKNKDLVVNETGRLLKDIILKMDDNTISDFIAKKGAELIQELKLNEIVANALQYFLDKKDHEQVITALAAKIRTYISGHIDMVQERVKKESYFFIPKFIDNKVAAKITNGLIRYFEEIETDKNHKIRIEITEQLGRFVHDLKVQDKWQKEFSQLKSGLLSEENLHQYAADLWHSLKQTIITELSDEHSALMRYFSRTIEEFAHNLQQDEVLRKKIDSWVRLTAYKYILRNTENAGDLISNTVGNWQGRELSRKLEIEVGKDLQFIRINGTIVGGLVGLLIYTITHMLSS